VRDLSWREIGALAPLAVFVFWIGLWPDYFFDRMAPTLDRSAAAARERQAVVSTARDSKPVAKVGPEDRGQGEGGRSQGTGGIEASNDS
jgi:hypothetical protein